MTRNLIVGICSILLLVCGIVLIGTRSSVQSLSSSELALKTVSAPAGFEDYCATTRREISKYDVPTVSRIDVSLNEDERTIYRVLLQLRDIEAHKSLNVSERTYPLDVTSPMILNSDCECIEGMDSISLRTAAHSFHNLPTDLLKGLRAKFVSPEKQKVLIRSSDSHSSENRGKSIEHAVKDAFDNGLFSMSEIVFDRDHERALVSSRFVCGELCGHGATYRFEKIGGTWRKTSQTCGGWIS